MDSGITLSSPSVEQKRDCAKGRSMDRHSTTVFSSPAARALNCRTDKAHVGVSRLGKIFSITFFPLKLDKLTSSIFALTARKSGASCPTGIIGPEVCASTPRQIHGFTFSLCRLLICTLVAAETGIRPIIHIASSIKLLLIFFMLKNIGLGAKDKEIF